MGHDDANHKSHLCELTKKGVTGDVKKLVKGAKFICGNCGRSAASEKNLCNPQPL